MRSYKLPDKNSFSDEQKIKKFDSLIKKVRDRIEWTVNENYGYDNIPQYVFEDTVQIMFGKKIFDILDEDKRGEVTIK